MSALLLCSEGSAQEKSLIGTFKLAESDYGCGCAFQRPVDMHKKAPAHDQFVFISNIDDPRTTKMNIDQKIVQLRMTKPNNKLLRGRVGERFTEVWGANGIEAKIDYVTTHVCRKGDEDCEATDYDVIISVTKEGRQQTVNAKGACGC